MGRVRREMNGAVSESMATHGQKYGLNYGVSVATIREIAATEQRDYDFAKYLYQQQVRELKLLACHLAEPRDQKGNSWVSTLRGSARWQARSFSSRTCC